MTLRRTVAAVLREGAPAPSLAELEVATIRPDEVLVRIAGAGICHTDLAAIDGTVPVPRPVVLGHEGAGIVVSRGDAVRSLEVGDAVVLSFDACRACAPCSRGLPGYCAQARVLNYSCKRADGSTPLRDRESAVSARWFGQSSWSALAVATERNAVKVPHEGDLALLAPLGCGLLTGAGTVMRVLRAREGQGLVVFGVGGVGAGAILAAAAAGCGSIVAVDPLPERRAIALALGATVALDPSEVGPKSGDLRRKVGPLDFAIDTVGTQAVITQALHALGAPGVCATLALRAGANEIAISQSHLLYGRTLVGVIEGDADPQVMIPELVALWKSGRFPFERIVRRFPFARFDEALESMRTGAVIKPILTFDEVTT